MIRWSPGTELANLHGTMDRLFDDLLGPSPVGNAGQRHVVPTYYLPLDIKQVENGYRIQAPVPGFKPEEVEITFSEGILHIQAQHSEDSRQEHGGYLRKEVTYSNYQRSIQLPGDIKEEEIKADFENGLLTVSVPKAPRPQPKKIQITGASPKQVSGKNLR